MEAAHDYLARITGFDPELNLAAFHDNDQIAVHISLEDPIQLDNYFVMFKATFWAGGLLIIFLTGCASPKFSYQAPPAQLNPLGPSIRVMPISDCRTNRDMDKVVAKGYLSDVQKAIGDELQSMNYFSAVTVVTNGAIIPVADLELNPALRQLTWEIDNYNGLLTKAVIVGFCGGIVGGGIYMATGVDVHGYSVLDVRLASPLGNRMIMDVEYSNSVTNRMKKGNCDSGHTKALMMSESFEKTMSDLKADLKKSLPIPTRTNSVIVTGPPAK